MARERKPSFWQNPIADKSHAERICKNVANVFLAIYCVLFAFFLVLSRGLATSEPVHILIVDAYLVVQIAAAFLLRQKYNLYAAYTLFGFSVLLFICGSIDVIDELVGKAAMSEIFSSALSALISWLFITATWRACTSIKKFLMPPKNQ